MNLSTRFYAISIAAAISSLLLYPPPVACAVDHFYKTYEWDYDGRHWTWSLYIPKSLYNQYSSVSVNDRAKNSQAGYGYLVTTHDQYVKEVADSLRRAATEKGYEAYDEVSFILAFVQSLRYTSDSVSTLHDEYPRFPVETLVDDGGDCEDTSILFAALVLILNYDAVFINPPKHYAVGVWGKNLAGTYFTHNSRRYYYCETTGDNFKIGDIPSEYKDTSAYIYAIDESRQYIPSQSTTTQPDQTIASTPDPAEVFLPIAILAGLVVIAIMTHFLKKSAGTQPEEAGSSAPIACRTTRLSFVQYDL